MTEWVREQHATSPDAHRPSSALQAALYLISHPSQFRSLTIPINPKEVDNYTLTVQVPASSVEDPSTSRPYQVVKPNPVLQTVFWHSARARGKAAPNLDTLCGFTSCDNACCPHDEGRLDFHVDRLFQSYDAANNAPAYRRALHASATLDFRFKADLNLLNHLPNDVFLSVCAHLSHDDLQNLVRLEPNTYNALLPVVPALKLKLFPHQITALDKMLRMERSYPCPRRDASETAGVTSNDTSDVDGDDNQVPLPMLHQPFEHSPLTMDRSRSLH